MADLLDGYPATLVKGLFWAARAHRRQMMMEQVAAMTVAVTSALDVAFNQGRGRVLDKWLEEVSPDKKPEPKKAPVMSERAFSFFNSLPRRRGSA